MLGKMTLRCPVCDAALSPFRINRQFRCPECTAPLRVNLDGPMVVGVILLVPLLGFAYLFRHWLKDLPGLVYIGALVGGGGSYGIWWLACHLSAKVERDVR